MKIKKEKKSMNCRKCGKSSVEIKDICPYCFSGILIEIKNCRFCEGKGYVVIRDYCQNCYMKIKTQFIPQINERDLNRLIKYDWDKKTIIYDYDEMEKIVKNNS